MKKLFNLDKKVWIIIATSLLLLLFISMGVMLAMIGDRSNPDYLGRVIDKIPLDPGEDEEAAFHMLGRVTYADGTPASGRTVVLRSKPNYTVSSSNANFFYDNVTLDGHSLYILTNGQPSANCNVTFVRSKDAQKITVVKKGDDTYEITLPLDLRVIEMTLEFDSESESLVIKEDKITEISRSGVVRTPGGAADITLYPVVSPLGNIFLPDGTIIIPSDGTGVNPTAVIDLNEKVTYVDDEITLSDGTKVSNDKVILPDGTEITKDGKVITPDGQVITPGDEGVQIIKDGDEIIVEPIGKETEDKSELIVTGRDKSGTYIRWSQNGEIDLFYNRTSGIADKDKIAPGSAGFYLFKLENTRSKNLSLTITLTEKSINIPLVVKVTPLDGEGNKINSKSVQGKMADGKLSLTDEIASSKTTVYLLEWEWPFEGGDDETDTAIGSEGGTYILNLNIYATEK